MSTTNQDFWVVSCYYNAHQDQNRRHNCEQFATSLQRQNVPVLMVELCKTNDEDGLPPDLFAKYIRVHHTDELWCKEALLNLGIDLLPASCTKVCWADADILFLDDTWATCCASLLDHHDVVQPFDRYLYLPKGESNVMMKHVDDVYNPSFTHAVTHGHFTGTSFRTAYPGCVWAANRSFLNRIGGLYTHAILGLADIVMCLGFLANTDQELEKAWHCPAVRFLMGSWNERMQAHCRQWQQTAMKATTTLMACPNRNIIIHHLYHGSPRSRDYNKTGSVLQQYDPFTHVAINSDGLLHWTTSAPMELQHQVAQYFAARNST